MSSNGSKSIETKPSASSVKNAWSKPLQPKTVVSPPPGMSTKTSSSTTGSGAAAARASGSIPSTITTTTTSNSSSAPVLLSDTQALLRERFVSLILVAVGQPITATLIDGTKLEGIFHNASPFENIPDEKLRNKYVFHQVNVLEKGLKFQFTTGSTAILEMSDVVNLALKDMRLDSIPALDKASNATTAAADGTGAAFRTDAEISAAAGAGKSKVLEAAGAAWTGGAGSARASPLTAGGPQRNSRAEALMGSSGNGNNINNSASGGGVAAAGPLQGNIGRWDQFEANKALFNVDATYDESLYTTSLDKSKIDAQQLKTAEKLAKEIESQTTTNIHMAEERGFMVETDYDEEDLYSGVIKSTDGKLNKKLQTQNKRATTALPPKMNYAAAAAKQTMPPGFNATGSGKPPQTPTRGAASESEKPTSPQASNLVNLSAASDATVTETVPVQGLGESKSATETKDDDNISKPVSKLKLNPNAKEFSLSVGAKPFTPNFTLPDQPPVVLQQHQHQLQLSQMQHVYDPNTGMHISVDPNMMHPNAYMQGPPMGHPGMMGLMPPQQFHPSMRYPGQFPGMDAQHQHHIVPVAPIPQASAPPQQSAPPIASQASGAASPMTASEDESPPVPEAMLDNESQSSSQAPQHMQMQQSHIPQQGIPQYSVPPHFYAHMHPPPQHGLPFAPQVYGMPQQISPGQVYRQPTYQMQPNLPPNMMRQHFVYGQGGPGHYQQQYGYDDGDNFRGGRGRGRNGGRGPNAGGRGAGRNNRNNNMSGRGGQAGRTYAHQQEGHQQHFGGSSTTAQKEESKEGHTNTFESVVPSAPLKIDDSANPKNKPTMEHVPQQP
ncbi:hypothetical protein MPSEU_000094700 [Mayamaea pseudoterrestris]|nr:hypothetical protein MPSEU_000094700 [Mayamaea pseudoterrestris]